MSIEAMKQARQIIWRYRHETPLGNQPHMIAHEADEFFNQIDQAIAEAEKKEHVGINGLTEAETNATASVMGLINTSPPQRQWVGLTDEEIDQGLLRSDYALQSAHAWRAGVVFAMTQLKEKNT